MKEVKYIDPKKIDKIIVQDKKIVQKIKPSDAKPARYFKLFNLKLFKLSDELKRGYNWVNYDTPLIRVSFDEYFEKFKNSIDDFDKKFIIEGDDNELIKSIKPRVNIHYNNTVFDDVYYFETFDDAVKFSEQFKLGHLIKFVY